MFVTCGNCDAEYELDEAKIPAGGARLRCTSCNHSFVVRPPEASDVRTADDLAREALTGARPSQAETDPAPESAPVESFDFYGEADADPEFEAAMDEGFDIDTEVGSDVATEAATDEGLDIDIDIDTEMGPDAEIETASEDGFDLNGDADPDPEFEALSDEGLDVESEADLESDFGSVSDEGFDLEAEAAPDSEFEAALDAASTEASDPEAEEDWKFNDEIATSDLAVDGSEPESPFDQGKDWNALSSAEDVVDDLLGSGGPIEEDAAAAVDDLLGEVDRVDSRSGEPDRESTSEPELPSQRLDLGDASTSDAAEGFGDLSDWDLFDQSAEGDGAPASSRTRDRLAAAARAGVRAEPQVGIAVAMAGDSPMTVRWTDRLSEVAGWAAVCALVLVALVSGLATNSSDARATAGSWSGAGFEADRIAGRWVDNAVAGSIYVVSGRIRRAAGTDRAARQTLGVRLIDENGRGIDRDPIPLAPAVPERVLREYSPAELDDFQLQRAGRIAAVGDRWVSFEAVLTELPRSAGRFELEAIDR